MTYALVAVVLQDRTQAMLRSGGWVAGRCTVATQTLIRVGYVDQRRGPRGTAIACRLVWCGR